MAFTGPVTARTLLVTDVGHKAVHVVDVAARAHAGYVAAPGSQAGPRGVAARGSLVAVSVWWSEGSGSHAVHVFEGDGRSWAPVRVVGSGLSGPAAPAFYRDEVQLKRPVGRGHGLRFTADGTPGTGAGGGG